MTRPLPLLGQAAAYLLFAAFLGIFSVAPSYTYLEADRAVIKLSFSHAGDRVGPCRRLTQEEIAALPANMRRSEECPRERLPLLVELELDGELATRRLLPPVGLHRDGASAFARALLAVAHVSRQGGDLFLSQALSVDDITWTKGKPSPYQSSESAAR